MRNLLRTLKSTARLVRVFSESDKRGNPAFIIQGIDENLSVMQKIANNDKAPVTVFLFPPQYQPNNFKVRFMASTGEELPVCGHGLLGAMSVIPSSVHQASFEVGEKMIEITRKHSNFYVISMQKIEHKDIATPHKYNLLEILGISEEVINRSLPFEIASVGVPLMLIPIINLDELYKISIDITKVLDWTKQNDLGGIYLYSHSESADIDFEVRCFNPRYNALGEDVATGAAAGALTSVLTPLYVRKNELKILQGKQLGAESQIFCKKTDDGSIEVGGFVTVCESAELNCTPWLPLSLFSSQLSVDESVRKFDFNKMPEKEKVSTRYTIKTSCIFKDNLFCIQYVDGTKSFVARYDFSDSEVSEKMEYLDCDSNYSAILPAGDLLVLATSFGDLRLVDPFKKEILQRYQVEGSIKKMTYSNDMLYVLCTNGRIYSVNLVDQSVSEFELFKADSFDLCLFDNWLVTCSWNEDKKMTLWSVDTRKVCDQFDLKSLDIGFVAKLLPLDDENIILCGDNLTLFNIKEGKVVCCYKNHGAMLSYTAATLVDNDTLIVGSSLGWIYTISAKALEEKNRFPIHKNTITNIHELGDGKIITTSLDASYAKLSYPFKSSQLELLMDSQAPSPLRVCY